MAEEYNLFGELVTEDEEIEEKYMKPSFKVAEYFESFTASKQDLREIDPALPNCDVYAMGLFMMQNENLLGFANLMNQMPNIPPEYQYVFYLTAIPKKKQWSKWVKSATSDDEKRLIDIGYSREQAKEIAHIFTTEQLDRLLTLNEGVQKPKRKARRKTDE